MKYPAARRAGGASAWPPPPSLCSRPCWEGRSPGLRGRAIARRRREMPRCVARVWQRNAGKSVRREGRSPGRAFAGKSVRREERSPAGPSLRPLRPDRPARSLESGAGDAAQGQPGQGGGRLPAPGATRAAPDSARQRPKSGGLVPVSTAKARRDGRRRRRAAGDLA